MTASPDPIPTSGQDRRATDLLRSERSMIVVRWVAVGFALLQILAYADRPYPDDLPVKALALTATALLAAGNAVAWFLLSRAQGRWQARRLAVGTLAMDILIASAIVWLWAFDQGSALWAVLFIPPLEGAIKFQLAGSLATWVTVTGIYVGREFWAAATYPQSVVQWNSITFRMGIGLIIAMVAGFMARNLTRQKDLLQRALTSVARTDALRASLVSTLAHDVRNPLAAIRGTLRTVLSRSDRMSDETRTELLTTADRQAARLERLAADLLDLARLERGRLELAVAPIRLRDGVKAALAYVDPHGDFEVTIDPDLVVRADAGRLEQIVVNLATNAFRYGKPPYEIEGTPEEGMVRMEVRDGGPGIPEEEAVELFQPFRGENHHGSVGFGLAIVQALASAHGGSAGYRRGRNGGACFEVRLPQVDEEPPPLSKGSETT